MSPTPSPAPASHRLPLGLGLHLGLLAAACACDPSPASPPSPAACSLVVVASDYSSTAVSLLDAEANPCAADLITSGSRPPGLLNALSGDVVLASTPSSLERLYLLDRYPNGVLTALSAQTGEVLAQARLSPGFAGNPQDAIELSGPPGPPRPTDLDTLPAPHVLAVTRLERHKLEPALGSDIAFFDLETLAPQGRLDLSAHADPGLDPMPTRFARTAGLVWVGLTHLAPDFSRAGPGRVLALAPTPDGLEVVARGELPTLANCGHLAPTPSADAVWVVCSGLFRDSPLPRLERSGLARFPLPASDRPTGPTPPTLAPDALLPASELGGPLAFSIAPIDHDTVAVVLLGDLAAGSPDRLALVTTRPGSPPLVTPLAEASTFELGGLLYLAEARLLLASDGDRRAPRVRRFDLASIPPRELTPVLASPTGLPPRHLQRIRPFIP